MAKKISPKIEEIVDNPVILDKAKEGCSFNNDDRQILKRNFEEMHEWLKELNTENQRFLAECIISANNLLFIRIDENEKRDLDVFYGTDDLRCKIDYYLKNEEERVNIARHGFETVQKFNRTNFAKRIIETTNKGVIYDQAIPKHRQKAA